MSGLTYKVGEVILCKHVPLDEAGYEAKIMESRPNTEGSGNEYLVHYKVSQSVISNDCSSYFFRNNNKRGKCHQMHCEIWT